MTENKFNRLGVTESPVDYGVSGEDRDQEMEKALHADKLPVPEAEENPFDGFNGNEAKELARGLSDDGIETVQEPRNEEDELTDSFIARAKEELDRVLGSEGIRKPTEE